MKEVDVGFLDRGVTVHEIGLPVEGESLPNADIA